MHQKLKLKYRMVKRLKSKLKLKNKKLKNKRRKIKVVFWEMIVFILKEKKDNSEVQFVLFLVTLILVKLHFWTKSEELMFNKVKQEVLPNKSVPPFSLNKNWLKKSQNVVSFWKLMLMFPVYSLLIHQAMKVSATWDQEVQVCVISLF